MPSDKNFTFQFTQPPREITAFGIDYDADTTEVYPLIDTGKDQFAFGKGGTLTLPNMIPCEKAIIGSKKETGEFRWVAVLNHIASICYCDRPGVKEIMFTMIAQISINFYSISISFSYFDFECLRSPQPSSLLDCYIPTNSKMSVSQLDFLSGAPIERDRYS